MGRPELLEADETLAAGSEAAPLPQLPCVFASTSSSRGSAASMVASFASIRANADSTLELQEPHGLASSVPSRAGVASAETSFASSWAGASFTSSRASAGPVVVQLRLEPGSPTSATPSCPSVASMGDSLNSMRASAASTGARASVSASCCRNSSCCRDLKAACQAVGSETARSRCLRNRPSMRSVHSPKACATTSRTCSARGLMACSNIAPNSAGSCPCAAGANSGSLCCSS
mmetsp:Transcript_70908/g.195847  ORF Transcript_70908/g.195847 Transcript_70908/m.195847 type:complete len:233 (-) Transcript_70908:150-848(-)